MRVRIDQAHVDRDEILRFCRFVADAITAHRTMSNMRDDFKQIDELILRSAVSRYEVRSIFQLDLLTSLNC